jgi:hypothetical protein
MSDNLALDIFFTKVSNKADPKIFSSIFYVYGSLYLNFILNFLLN